MPRMWLTGASAQTMAIVLGVTVLATIGLGGLRSLTWSGTAAALAVIIAMVVPAAIVGTEVTNFPARAAEPRSDVASHWKSVENIVGVPIPKAIAAGIRPRG